MLKYRHPYNNHRIYICNC